MKNYYPEKPLVDYVKTKVEMGIVIAYLKALTVSPEVKRMAYIMFRNESGNGQRGICNNYCGFQADSGRWSSIHDTKISGIVRKVENGTGKERLFLAFHDVTGCLGMLIDRVIGRGLFIGGTTTKVWQKNIQSVNDLCRAYKKEWVTGSAKAEPTPQDIVNFTSMYNQAVKLFS